MEKALNEKKIILTLIGFIVFWAVVTNAWGYSEYIFKNDLYNTGAYIYGYISRFIWVMPSILLIFKYDSKLKFNRKALFSRPEFNKSLALVITILLVYVIAGMMINHKGFWFNREVSFGLVSIKYMIVGFVEEIVFRGWGYNSLANIMSHNKAAIISTALFVLLHWPSYFIKFLRFGVFDFTGMISQSIGVFILGLVFCWLLEKGKTIWNPIIVHTIYDLMYVLLLGGS